jgi:plastocyanin
MKKILQGVLIVSSIALIALGCNKTDDKTNSSANNASNLNTNSTSNANTPANTAANTNASANVAVTTKTFVVVGDDFRFSPAEIRVKQGDTVVINFSNPDSMPHDWVVDAFSASTKQITKGQSDTVTFVASKKGTFEYYCSVGNHREMGMKGSLIVE